MKRVLLITLFAIVIGSSVAQAQGSGEASGTQCWIDGRLVGGFPAGYDCSGAGGGSSSGSNFWSRRAERIQEENEDNARRYNRCNELIHQGHALYDAKRYAEALDLYLQAKSVYPKGWTRDLEQLVANARSMIYVTDAQAAIDRDDYERAAGLIREAISINPKHAYMWEDQLKHCESDSLTKRALELINQGNYQEAERMLTRAVKIYPKSSWAYRSLGAALNGQSRYREAEVFLRQAIQLGPASSWAHNKLGEALENQKRYAEAEAAYREAIKIDPRNSTAHENLGDALRQQKRSTEAEAAYREAIKLEPDGFWAHNGLGIALENQKRYGEAEAAYRQAVKLNPNDSGAHLALGFVLVQQNRHAEAEAAYRQAIKLNPGNSAAHFQLGLTLLSQNHYTEAEAAYRELIRLTPNNRGAYNALGVVLDNQNRHAEAEAAYRQAIKLDPDFALAHRNLGDVLTGQNRYAEAEAAYRQATKLDPNDTAAHRSLGNILKDQKRYAEAETAYRKVLSIEPADKDVQALLQSLSATQQEEIARKHSTVSLSQPPDASAPLPPAGSDLPRKTGTLDGKVVQEAEASVYNTQQGKPGVVFDDKDKRTPYSSWSDAAVPGTGQPSPMSERARKDPDMIAAQKELADLQANRQKLDDQRTRLAKERNSAGDAENVKQLTKELDKVEKDYQANLLAASNQSKKIEKLKRTIDAEVEKPISGGQNLKGSGK